MTTRTDARAFVNYYEILELNPSASAEAIDGAFRRLARLYHPDNQATGNRARFDAVVQAHDTLKDVAKRTQYHDDNNSHLPPFWGTAAEPSQDAQTGQEAEAADGDAFFDGLGIDRDVSIQNNILILLYFRRRRSPREPGIGDAELERLSGCPPENLEFHIWYLRHKGWIAVGEDGLLAITIDGVDRAAHIYQEGPNKLLTAQG
ncbi:MAG: J domain-containing protein [Caulobacteraceae bacterium]